MNLSENGWVKSRNTALYCAVYMGSPILARLGRHVRCRCIAFGHVDVTWGTAAGSSAVTRKRGRSKTPDDGTCWNCQKPGHLARDCPTKPTKRAKRGTTPAVRAAKRAYDADEEEREEKRLRFEDGSDVDMSESEN